MHTLPSEDVVYSLMIKLAPPALRAWMLRRHNALLHAIHEAIRIKAEAHSKDRRIFQRASGLPGALLQPLALLRNAQQPLVIEASAPMPGGPSGMNVRYFLTDLGHVHDSNMRILAFRGLAALVPSSTSTRSYIITPEGQRVHRMFIEARGG